MSAPAGRSRGPGGELGEDQDRAGMEAEVRGGGSNRRQRLGVATETVRSGSEIEGDCFDREHVSPAVAGTGEDSASSVRLFVPRRLPAVVWKAGAGAVEPVRPGGVAEFVEHSAERNDRRR